MRPTVALFGLAAAVALIVVGAADAAVKKGLTLSLDPAKGYFHQLHVKKMQLGCASCHSADPQDVLFLRRDHVMPANMPGQVNRTICLGCHNTPSKPAWYGLSR